MTGDELRSRCSELVEEILGADSHDDAVDAVVALATEVQTAGLSRGDRRGLAAVLGYELGLGEGALEVENIRRLLERHGIAPADALGVHRTTIAMLEEALVARPAGP